MSVLPAEYEIYRHMAVLHQTGTIHLTIGHPWTLLNLKKRKEKRLCCTVTQGRYPPENVFIWSHIYSLNILIHLHSLVV